jgi:hypothetical protein
MPTPYTLVLSAGTCEGLEYGLWFMNRTAQIAQKAGITAILTDGYPDSITKALTTIDSAEYYAVGHGLACLLTVECTQLYLMAGPYTDTVEGYTYSCLKDINLDKVKNRHVHLLSCFTAKYLGKQLVYKAGAKSYIGYADYFIYGCDVDTASPPPGSPPSPEADFYTFMDADAAGEETIIKMGMVKEAVQTIMAVMDYYIEKYTTGEWKDWPNAAAAAWCHLHNKSALRVYGDTSWRPMLQIGAPTRSQIIASLASPLTFAAGLTLALFRPTY